MSNNYTLECFIHYIHLSFFSLPSSRSLPFFFFNKEIMGDKLEEEEKKHLPSMMKLKNIYIYTYVLQNKYNIARILSKIFPNGCCKINSRNDERTERVR